MIDPTPVREFSVTRTDGETWTNAVLFRAADVATMTDEEIVDQTGLYEWHSEFQSFGRRPLVSRSRSRVLVTQGCGLDI